MDKKQLYESIMKSVAKEVKKALNEELDINNLKDGDEVMCFIEMTKHLGDNAGLAKRAIYLFDVVFSNYFDEEVTIEDADSEEFYEDLICNYLVDEAESNDTLYNCFYTLVDYFKDNNNANPFGLAESHIGELLNIYTHTIFGYPMVY